MEINKKIEVCCVFCVHAAQKMMIPHLKCFTNCVYLSTKLFIGWFIASAIFLIRFFNEKTFFL